MHSATLLIILYVTPFAAILWHTLGERLPIYRQTFFPEIGSRYKEFDLQKTLPFVIPFPIASLIGYIASDNMSTRYWDEIDWYIQEGTQKLCEMLNSESDDASSKWSTGEVEEESPLEEKNEIIQKSSEEATQKLTKKFENLTVKDGVSDCDSDKDEDFIERSTSVEDEGTPIIKKQTNVDDLLSLCSKCGMLAPIYTYYTTDDEQVVSTVQLWNGSRFSSHPQKTRDKAMEEAAGQGLGYLRNELRENRPVSTSPPATSPYYVTLHNVVTPQYYPTHAFASPVTYASAPHPYYYPTTPYTMLPTGPVVTMPSEYTQPALLQHGYRYNPQYTSPYFQHYPVAPTMQVSPTHQPKRQNMYQHQVGASAQPVLWNYYYKDGYLIQDKANAPRTEFKLLDQPPVSKDSEDEKTKRNAEQPAAKDTDSADKADVKTSGDDPTKASTPQKQNQSKPKLAISFNQENN